MISHPSDVKDDLYVTQKQGDHPSNATDTQRTIFMSPKNSQSENQDKPEETDGSDCSCQDGWRKGGREDETGSIASHLQVFVEKKDQNFWGELTTSTSLSDPAM